MNDKDEEEKEEKPSSKKLRVRGAVKDGLQKAIRKKKKKEARAAEKYRALAKKLLQKVRNVLGCTFRLVASWPLYAPSCDCLLTLWGLKESEEDYKSEVLEMKVRELELTALLDRTPEAADYKQHERVMEQMRKDAKRLLEQDFTHEGLCLNLLLLKRTVSAVDGHILVRILGPSPHLLSRRQSPYQRRLCVGIRWLALPRREWKVGDTPPRPETRTCDRS